MRSRLVQGRRRPRPSTRAVRSKRKNVPRKLARASKRRFAAPRPQRGPQMASRVVAGPQVVGGLTREGPTILSDMYHIPITKASASKYVTITPSCFQTYILPHLRMYEHIQLLSLKVTYISVVATGRDGMLVVAWDYSGNAPGDFDTVMRQQTHQQVVLWQTSPQLTVKLPATFGRLVDKARALSDTHGHFAPAQESDVSIGYVHTGIDATAPDVLGYLQVVATVRLLHLSPVVAAAVPENGPPLEPEEPEALAAQAHVPGISPPAVTITSDTATSPPAVALGSGEWESDPAPAERAYRSVSVAPPVGPAMAAARARPRVSPARNAVAEQQ